MTFIAKKPLQIMMLSLSIGLVSACAKIEPSPVEQVQKANKATAKNSAQVTKVSKAKAQTESRFVCQNDRQVRVTYLKKQNGRNAKSNRVTVSYNGMKYSNMRWTWWEPRNGKATLLENPQKPLAENCTKKK